MINNDLQTVMENYSKFLHDGDFEKYQPLINTPITEEIEQYLAREFARLYWIKGRFVEHLDAEWCANHAHFCQHEREIKNSPDGV